VTGRAVGATIPSMNRDTVLARLQRHEAELKQLGVLSLSLFGSTARDEATAESDVDLAVTLTPGPRGDPHLDRMRDLRDFLSDLLNAPVDVIEEPTSRPRLQAAIDQDRQRAF
jgi:predicted nucleotidyltransferase